MEDPVHQICPLEDLLFTAGKRVEIAKELLKLKRYDLLPTILEDLFHGCQTILDDFCVRR